jgi:dolichol-phosphate mannosyltransferase
MTERIPRAQAKLSVVLPLLNEAGVLPRLLADLRTQLDSIGCRWNVVLVNDGSTDESGDLLDAMAYADRRLRIIHLSRNFGHQSAIHAGLNYADGEVVVLMDSDGQDDPTAIGRMFDRWQSGDDVVYAVRYGRKEGPIKRLLFKTFYSLLSRVASVDIPRDAGNFSLLDRRVVDELLRLDERDRYVPGLRSWLGFRQSSIRVERFARHDKQTRVSILGLISLAKNAFFGFSRAPLLAFYYLAFAALVVTASCFSAVIGGSYFNLALPTSVLIQCGVVALFGSLNSLGIAVLGEYIARIYDQVRARPHFLVDRTANVQLEPQYPTPPIQDSKDDLLLDELNAIRAMMPSDSKKLPERSAVPTPVASSGESWWQG